MRTCVYIDGFNLYYGSLKKTSYKWLDLKKLSQALLAEKNDIIKIKLFTAHVKPTVNDKTAHLRQQAYLQALKHSIPELEIISGHFLQHAVSLPLSDGNGDPILKDGKLQFVTVCKREEKGSDVNLAVHFINDACADKYDCGVIVSNDSDLAEAMRLVKAETKKVIGIISPCKTMSKELKEHSHFQKMIRPSILAACQMPDSFSGTTIKKPTTW